VITREAGELRQLLDGLTTQEALAASFETHLTEASALLLRLQDRLDAIEAADWAQKREIVRLLVHEVRVTTEGEGAHKQARVLLRYAFGQPREVDTARDCATWSPRRPRERTGPKWCSSTSPTPR
jgi:hypothetical protein